MKPFLNVLIFLAVVSAAVAALSFIGDVYPFG